MDPERVISQYDARQEFTKGLHEQTVLMFEYFMRDQHAVVLKTAQYVYFSVRALLTDEEAKELAGAMNEATLAQSRGLHYSVFADQVNNVVSLLFDALHSHKLLLPTYRDEEVGEPVDFFTGSGL